MNEIKELWIVDQSGSCQPEGAACAQTVMRQAIAAGRSAAVVEMFYEANKPLNVRLRLVGLRNGERHVEWEGMPGVPDAHENAPMMHIAVALGEAAARDAELNALLRGVQMLGMVSDFIEPPIRITFNDLKKKGMTPSGRDWLKQFEQVQMLYLKNCEKEAQMLSTEFNEWAGRPLSQVDNFESFFAHREALDLRESIREKGRSSSATLNPKISNKRGVL